MPGTVTEFYEDRGAWRWDAADGRTTGVTASYRAHVSADGCSVPEALLAAIGATPQYGTEWPETGDGLFAKSHSAELISKSSGDSPEWIVRVSVQFVPAEDLITEFVFTFRSSMEQVEAVRDSAGTLLAIGYTDPDEVVMPPVTVPLDKLQAMGELQAVGVIDTSDPISYADAWINKINSDEFLGIGAKKLLCSEVSFEPFPVGRYMFRFTFLLKPTSWDEVITYVGSDGLIPVDVSVGNGQAVVQLYETLAFWSTPPFGEGS